MAPADRHSADQWFVSEVLPHEASLTRYLHRVWPDHSEVSDLRQEIYVRLYEHATRSPRDLPTSVQAKSLMFVIARHLMTDRRRRERIVSIDYTQDLEDSNVLVDEISPEHRLSARQDLRRFSDALDQLPAHCRTAIWLRRVEGLTTREITERMQVSEGALEGYLTRGIRALMKVVFGGTIEGDPREDVRGSDHGRHG